MTKSLPLTPSEIETLRECAAVGIDEIARKSQVSKPTIHRALAGLPLTAGPRSLIQGFLKAP
jgi:hypothetical protein